MPVASDSLLSAYRSGELDRAGGDDGQQRLLGSHFLTDDDFASQNDTVDRRDEARVVHGHAHVLEGGFGRGDLGLRVGELVLRGVDHRGRNEAFVSKAPFSVEGALRLRQHRFDGCEVGPALRFSTAKVGDLQQPSASPARTACPSGTSSERSVPGARA